MLADFKRFAYWLENPGGYCARTRVAGKATSTRVPSLTWLVMRKRAWLASACALLIGRPSPVPSARLEVASWRNGSSAVCNSFSLMPVSYTHLRAHETRHD